MRKFFKLALAVFLLLHMSAAAYAETAKPVAKPEKFCEDFMFSLSSNGSTKAAATIADTIGQPSERVPLQRALQGFDGKRLEALSKVADFQIANALRQIIYYTYIEGVGFIYFRFNFKMTGRGWVLASFLFKQETNELFPKDFVYQ